MATINTEELSPFAQAAIALEHEFIKFDKYARELEHLDVLSDKGMIRAQTLIDEITACRSRLAVAMGDFAKNMEASRDRCDKAEQVIAARTVEVQSRQLEAERMLNKFRVLGEMVQKISSSIVGMKQPDGRDLTTDEKSFLVSQFPSLNEKIELLVEEGRKLVEEAKSSNMKMMERNADSLRKSLQAARNRLNLFINGHGDNSKPH